MATTSRTVARESAAAACDDVSRSGSCAFQGLARRHSEATANTTHTRSCYWGLGHSDGDGADKGSSGGIAADGDGAGKGFQDPCGCVTAGRVERGYFDDFWFFCKNNHPLLSIVFADEDHPVSRQERLVMEAVVVVWCFLCATAAESQCSKEKCVGHVLKETPPNWGCDTLPVDDEEYIDDSTNRHHFNLLAGMGDPPPRSDFGLYGWDCQTTWSIVMGALVADVLYELMLKLLGCPCLQIERSGRKKTEACIKFGELLGKLAMAPMLTIGLLAFVIGCIFATQMGDDGGTFVFWWLASRCI